MSFSNSKIFDNSKVNAILDRIWYECQQFNADVNTIMCLSGRAGHNLQQPEAQWKACNNIILAVKDNDLYDYVLNTMGEIVKNNGVVKFKERVLYYFDDFFLEIWKLPNAEIIQLAVPVHQSGDIPQILL